MKRSGVLFGAQIALVIDPFGARATLVVIAVGRCLGHGAGGRGRRRPGGHGGAARAFGVLRAGVAPRAAHGRVSH